MEDTIYIYPDDIEKVDTTEYCTDVAEHFIDMPEVAKPLINSTKRTFKKIEQMLFSVLKHFKDAGKKVLGVVVLIGTIITAATNDKTNLNKK